MAEETERTWAGPIIDAHQHFWDLSKNYHPWLSDKGLVPHRYGDYTAVKRSYLPPEYLADTAGHRVAMSVYVEAEWDPRNPIGEIEYVTALNGEFGYPNAIVGQAWLDTREAPRQLAALASFGLVRSIRHKPGGPASPESAGHGQRTLMSNERWRQGYACLKNHHLHFDLQAPWWNLHEAALLARDFPETTLIVNHAGVPGDRSAATLQGWRDAMALLADYDNVVVKISGLCQKDAPWTIESNAWIVQESIAMFGTGRIIFGSNFPVDGMLATFDTIFSGFKEMTKHLSHAEQKAVFFDTANRIYRPMAHVIPNDP